MSITLDGMLQWQHFSEITPEGVNELNQIALLTRNIHIQGNPDDTVANDNMLRFGGHMMFLETAQIRLSNIEVGPNMGQSGRLGRYPVHFHLAGNGTGSYVQDASIHDNFQRCLVIHGTTNIVVERTVGFKTFGHCFFLEDGVEVENRFAFNLGFGTENVPDGPLQILPSDSEVATFWVTNPDNEFVHNVAAGSQTFGMWLAFPEAALGPSAELPENTDVRPRRTTLGNFAHNIIHSNNRDGLFVDRGPDENNEPNGGPYNPVLNPIPVEDPDRPGETLNDEPVEAIFDHFTCYKNRNRGAWLRGGLLTVRNSFFADNAIGITFATNVHTGLIIDSIFVGETNNVGSPRQNEVTHSVSGRSLPFPWDPQFHIRGFEFYDGPVSVTNCEFYAFVPDAQRGSSAISMLRRDQFSIAPTNDASALFFSPEITRRVEFPDFIHDGDRDSLFLDLDGSVTGRPPANNQRAVVVNRDPFYITNSCIQDLDDGQGTVRVCPDHFAYLQVSTRNPGLFGLDSVQLFRDDLPATPRQICGGLCPGDPDPNSQPDPAAERTSFRSSIIRDIGHTLHIPAANGDAFPGEIELLVLYTFQQIDGQFNEYRIGVCLPPGAVVSNVVYNFNDQTQPATDLNAFDANPVTLSPFQSSGNGMWFHDTTNNYLYVRMVPFQQRGPTDRAAFPAAQFRFNVAAAGSGAPSCTPNNVAALVDPGIPPLAASPSVGPFGAGTPAETRAPGVDCALSQEESSSASLLFVSVSLAVALLLISF